MTDDFNHKSFVALAKDMVEMVGQTFSSPTDDWSHLAILITEEGGIFAVTLPTPEDPVYKDLTASTLANIARERHASMVAIIQSSWLTKMPGKSVDDIPDDYRPSEDPSRYEAVVLYIVSPDEASVHIGEIKRSPHWPPKICLWESFAEAEAEIMSARFIDALRPALATQTTKE